MQQPACGRQCRERPAQIVLATLLHAPPARVMHLLVCTVAGCGNSSFSGQTRGEDLIWLHGDSPKGLECGQAATGDVCRTEPRSAIGAPLSMHVKGEWLVPPQQPQHAQSRRGSTTRSSESTQALAVCPHVEVGLKSEPIPHGCTTWKAGLKSELIPSSCKI